MQNNQGFNRFQSNQNTQQYSFNNNNPNFGNVSGNRLRPPQQFDRFSRPNLTPPRSLSHNEGFGGRLEHRGPWNPQNVGHNSQHTNQNDVFNVRSGSLPNNTRMPRPQFRPEHRFLPPPNQGSQHMPVMVDNQPFNLNVPPPNANVPPPNPNVPPPNFHPSQVSMQPPAAPSHIIRPPQQTQGFNPQPFPLPHPQLNMQERFPTPLENKQRKNQEMMVKSQLEKMKESSQRADDEKWVKEWTKKTGKSSDDMKKESYMVSDAQEKTRHMMVLLARLQKGKQNLESMKNEDKLVWEQKLKEVMHLKNELETLHSDLTKEETITALKRKVDRTRKKRERIKRQKIALFEKKKEEEARREEINAKVDKKIQQVIEKHRVKKQEEEMKKEADQILSQVRKKISDANKTIQLLNGVQKLRNLRKDRLERQGVLNMYGPQGGSLQKSLMFENKVTDMVGVLNKQLETYKAEEEALKVILETEQEETREKEREKAVQKQREKQRQDRLNEQKMLFGNQKDPKPGDPLYPFWQYYTAAENSLEALVSIRQNWDMYLTLPHTPGATCIPTDWVIPPEPSSDTWNSALQDSGVS